MTFLLKNYRTDNKSTVVYYYKTHNIIQLKYYIKINSQQHIKGNYYKITSYVILKMKDL